MEINRIRLVSTEQIRQSSPSYISLRVVDVRNGMCYRFPIRGYYKFLRFADNQFEVKSRQFLLLLLTFFRSRSGKKLFENISIQEDHSYRTLPKFPFESFPLNE